MKQISFPKVGGWGGRRKGAGRKNRSGLAGHAAREHVDFKKPLHITVRLKDSVGSLRRPRVHRGFRQAMARARLFGLHILEYSLQGNHFHMIVEAQDNEALANGMRSLNASLWRVFGAPSGGIFVGRYDLKVISSPLQMKRTLRYVLLNTSKHSGLIPHIDEYSSGSYFEHWPRLVPLNAMLAEQLRPRRQTREEVGLSAPRSWLARQGWFRASSA